MADYGSMWRGFTAMLTCFLAAFLLASFGGTMIDLSEDSSIQMAETTGANNTEIVTASEGYQQGFINYWYFFSLCIAGLGVFIFLQSMFAKSSSSTYTTR